MEAYQAVLDKTSTVGAPWHVVPADRKWYARLAVQQLLLEASRPRTSSGRTADFDVEAEKKRLVGELTRGRMRHIGPSRRRAVSRLGR